MSNFFDIRTIRKNGDKNKVHRQNDDGQFVENGGENSKEKKTILEPEKRLDKRGCDNPDCDQGDRKEQDCEDKEVLEEDEYCKNETLSKRNITKLNDEGSENQPAPLNINKEDGFVEAPKRFFFTPITDAECDVKTVRILKQLMSGMVSEFSAVSTYVYQHTITQISDAELSLALERIAQDEMRHLEQLALAIVQFGGRPKFTSSTGVYWNARYANYSIVTDDFLRKNIYFEKQAIKDYENAITRVTNESLKQLFREIIEQEKGHIVIFEQFLNTNNQ